MSTSLYVTLPQLPPTNTNSSKTANVLFYAQASSVFFPRTFSKSQKTVHLAFWRILFEIINVSVQLYCIESNNFYINLGLIHSKICYSAGTFLDVWIFLELLKAPLFFCAVHWANSLLFPWSNHHSIIYSEFYKPFLIQFVEDCKMIGKNISS